MGFLEALQGDRIYLDTKAWIYALEGYSEFRPGLTQLITTLEQIQQDLQTLPQDALDLNQRL